MDDLVEYLLNFALKHKISCRLVPLPDDFVSRCVPKDRFILINSSLYKKPYYPFMIGHEIGHIMNGDTGVLYFQSPTAKYSTEHAADLFSLKLLYKYSLKRGNTFHSAYQFLEQYGIPSAMLSDVEKILAK